MTVYADNRPVTIKEMIAEFGLIMPESPAEYVTYLIEQGEYAEAYDVQQRQIREGRRAALNGESCGDHNPIAYRVGYVEALQDMEF